MATFHGEMQQLFLSEVQLLSFKDAQTGKVDRSVSEKGKAQNDVLSKDQRVKLGSIWKYKHVTGRLQEREWIFKF